MELPEGVREGLDLEFDEATERAEVEERERLKSRWARVEAIVGAEKRLAQVAADIVDHWETRQAAEVGKGLIVCMTRRICVAPLRRDRQVAAGLAHRRRREREHQGGHQRRGSRRAGDERPRSDKGPAAPAQGSGQGSG